MTVDTRPIFMILVVVVALGLGVWAFLAEVLEGERESGEPGCHFQRPPRRRLAQVVGVGDIVDITDLSQGRPHQNLDPRPIRIGKINGGGLESIDQVEGIGEEFGEEEGVVCGGWHRNEPFCAREGRAGQVR